MDITDVRKLGLHETLTWIVDQTAQLCEAIREEYLEPSLESLRARVEAEPARPAQTQAQIQT
jgi:hypothetical protein